ncbi:MAG: hypothetical protein GTO45_06920 [Candidatus Aminicenantes bacterium]|nr:hypothetical protein [Candidatus Aminicenantes bacterium]NIM78572.1 hypothetical protein [Candidatus Aminicenantes bacterium]NIN17818.1 hypothetical protein [Candidatus Aminicenantes bacterium]NIN41722.1 hypothetical protein [Candidatus Aminicenantes bacterium]NIN84471.1 hypothetical protein [Candidatus Aminicenantes bacterium]
MLKKEFRDTLMILLQSSILLLSIPIIMMLSLVLDTNIPFHHLLSAASFITVLAFTGYSGLAMFQSERKDKGFEYLLTLPLSKLKLLIFKMLPRLSVLVFIGGIYALLANVGNVKNYFIALLIFHLAAAFLSLAFQSLFPGVVAVILLAFLFTLYNRFLSYMYQQIKELAFNPFSMVSPYILASFLLLVPLGISFFLALKNLDLKPYTYSIRPYLFIALPVILLQAIFIAVYYDKFVRL